MKYTSLFRFYWFGTCLRYLQDAAEGSKVKGYGLIAENIDSFFSYLDELELTVTKRVAESQLNKLKAKLKGYEDDQRLSSEDSTALSNAMQTIRTTLDAEIEGLGAYMPTPKRIDLHKLLEKVADLFAPGIFGKLPDVARYDFTQAGKCIAYDLPTAAAFHILRGTEDVLRYYYCQMVRQKRITEKTWVSGLHS